MRLLRDANSKTGWSALVVLRDIQMRGPLAKGRYVLADRKFTGRHTIDFGGVKRNPRVNVTIDWQPSGMEWQMAIHRKRLDKARSLSPILK